MDRKVLLLVGLLVIVAAGAFVYFDPMDLNLLGLKPETVVAKPAMPTHPAAPVAHPPAAKPMPVVATPHPAPAPATAPAAVPASAPPVAPMSVAASKAEEPAAAKPAMAPTQSPMESSKTAKAESTPVIDKPVRPKNLDLRHCLKLETNAAIAKCAGE